MWTHPPTGLTIVPDDFQHEQATCFDGKGKGLVVTTSCGHRGIVNSMRGAIKVSGISKVHAIIGGFHLMPTPPEYVRSTVAALKEKIRVSLGSVGDALDIVAAEMILAA